MNPHFIRPAECFENELNDKYFPLLVPSFPTLSGGSSGF